MDSVIINKGYVIRKMIKQDQHEVIKYVAFQQVNATVNSVEQAWVFNFHEEAFQWIASMEDGMYSVDPIFHKSTQKEVIVEDDKK